VIVPHTSVAVLVIHGSARQSAFHPEGRIKVPRASNRAAPSRRLVVALLPDHPTTGVLSLPVRRRVSEHDCSGQEPCLRCRSVDCSRSTRDCGRPETRMPARTTHSRLRRAHEMIHRRIIVLPCSMCNCGTQHEDARDRRPRDAVGDWRPRRRDRRRARDGRDARRDGPGRVHRTGSRMAIHASQLTSCPRHEPQQPDYPDAQAWRKPLACGLRPVRTGNPRADACPWIKAPWRGRRPCAGRGRAAARGPARGARTCRRRQRGRAARAVDMPRFIWLAVSQSLMSEPNIVWINRSGCATNRGS
jgi:hypothetical protein